MDEYIYANFERILGNEMTIEEIDELTRGGWERCELPEGVVIGRELGKEMQMPHTIYSFRKPK